MELVSENTLWTEINDIPRKFTYLSEDIECDVAIIGGGITGAICGYYFAKAGIDTVIVDKNIVGYGSTSASTSILQYEIDTDLTGLKMMIGEEKATRCFKLCEKAVYDIGSIIDTLDDKCSFTYRDCFYYSKNEAEYKSMKDEYELRKKNGFDVEFLDENSAKNRFSFPVKAGIYSNSGAAEIDPYRFTHALISDALNNGMRIYENTEISKIINKDDYVILSTRNRFKIKAKKVIIATGFEAINYVKEKIVNLYRSFTVVTKPIKSFNGWHNQCIIRDTESPYTYLRATLDNRIIIGGEDLQIKNRGSKLSKLTNSDPISKEKYNTLFNNLKSYFPDINDLEIEYNFNGIFGDTNDSLPYIGEYEGLPNCYFCLGYGANGILYAILGGQMLRDLYLGNPSPDLELFKFNRKSTLQELY
ncbi:NAD(P)/FAD-dependent oxidoreductase [Caldisalinibacter kiritimatiensis]|uniref:Putative oxidoreductase n=1 Tax=Caldisalinibacter kiritimatiensis TaxID=1304284 RepID=R1CVR4_9FIRM|nr:FAD-dependent oxidoreductase [Caldisalinibacter kiritimatiensis]EOD00729.1 putative oxidoreductase [Caldisalinibacter kiritimatiensis]